jgi:hypothetical protein
MKFAYSFRADRYAFKFYYLYLYIYIYEILFAVYYLIIIVLISLAFSVVTIPIMFRALCNFSYGLYRQIHGGSSLTSF